MCLIGNCFDHLLQHGQSIDTTTKNICLLVCNNIDYMEEGEMIYVLNESFDEKELIQSISFSTCS